MGGYINPDGNLRAVSKVFGNVNGKTVPAKSLWVNRNGSPACIFSEGDKTLYIVGLDAGAGNAVFPMAYSYDFETFRACSITLPSNVSYKPTTILDIIYSKELNLFVALGYYLQKNYTSSSALRWYLMYSEDGKNWEVGQTSSYTYYSTDIRLVYEPSKHLFLAAIKGVNPSKSGFYFYSSTDGKIWTETKTITPTNVSNTKLYTAYNVNDLLVPGDGYIYLSGTANTTFYDGSLYYPFLRTIDGVNYEVYRVGGDYNAANLMYGTRSLLYLGGKYYSLDNGMYLYNSETTSQSKDYYNVGIHVSSDNMQTWEFVPLDVSSINKDWKTAYEDGFFLIEDRLLCSISKNSSEFYVYGQNSDGSWVKESAVDNIMSKVYNYLYLPSSEGNMVKIGEKYYRTKKFRLSSTEDGVVYNEESSLAKSMRSPFSLSSSNIHSVAVKSAG